MTQQGFFLDPPNRKFGLDNDGTRGFAVDVGLGNVYQASVGQLQSITDLNNSSYWGASRSYSSPSAEVQQILYFPCSYDITHMFYSQSWHNDYDSGGSTLIAMEWSNNSLSPLTGTWTQFTAPYNIGGGAYGPGGQEIPQYRTPTVINLPGVTAIRIRSRCNDGGYTGNGTNIYALHIYGHISAGAEPHRLSFTDGAGAELYRDFDFGDTPRGSTFTWSPSTTYNQPAALYVKNISTQKTANTVAIAVDHDDPNDMYQYINLSLDNITYTSTLNFASIAPNTLIGPIYIQYTPPAAEALGLKECRLKTTVNTWT